MRYYNDDFLKKLYEAQLKTHYVKIILLSFDEKILREIQGEITSGNISVNSSSAIRRTITLSMIVKNETAKIVDIENEISINKKIKIEIGLLNPFKETIEEYGNIIWFPQGIFVLSSVSTSRNTNGYNLSISAKDKMCLLDGTAGGTFSAPIVFHERQIYLKDGSIKIEYPILRQIIYEAVNHYGGEAPNNIFINDLEDTVRMRVKYDGIQPIYFIQDATKGYGTYSFSEPEEGVSYKKFLTGEDVGYELTDFTYPGELILSAGDTVVTLLDKIVKVLGNYEFFYDIEGRFIFQEIKNYINKQSPLDQLINVLPDLAANDYRRIYNTNTAIYSLTNLNKVISINHTPKYDNIKNDFVVWGERTEGHLIHYHLAIDAKPLPDFALQKMTPLYNNQGELIDYRFDLNFDSDIKDILFVKAGAIIRQYNNNNNTYKDISVSIDTFFPIFEEETTGYSLGKTKREYWINKTTQANNFIPYKVGESLPALPISQYEWREELYRQALYAKTKTGYESANAFYYAELENSWRKLYDPNKTQWDATNHWNPDVFNNPQQVDFWLDFIDTGSTLGQYAVGQIGRRTKAVNNNEIKTIYNKEIPDIIFIPALTTEGKSEAEIAAESEEREKFLIAHGDQQICQLPTKSLDLFSISSTGASCFDEMRNLLYQHLNYNTTISIQCLPIYYLEPNNILYIEDAKSGIIGNYQITQFSLPLTYNGVMNITAAEIFERI